MPLLLLLSQVLRSSLREPLVVARLTATRFAQVDDHVCAQRLLTDVAEVLLNWILAQRATNRLDHGHVRSRLLKRHSVFQRDVVSFGSGRLIECALAHLATTFLIFVLTVLLVSNQFYLQLIEDFVAREVMLLAA